LKFPTILYHNWHFSFLSLSSQTMIEINVRDNESLEKALRRFKKKWERSGVLKDVKRKSFYEKPSVTKRIAKKQTLRRIARLAKYNN
tara:strand:+ start:567 stop:827 length:261 start_codon:yes stop_codon:yes gene_type:complete